MTSLDPSISETTPLLSSSAQSSSSASKHAKPRRTVTFDSHVSTSDAPTIILSSSSSIHSPPHDIEAQPSSSATDTTGASVISTINSKLRRRNNQTSTAPTPATPAQKIGPQRTTKVAQKLKILPVTEQDEDGEDDSTSKRDVDVDVYAQFNRIKDPTSRRHAARLGREDRNRLPRVTAYCTAGSYRMSDLMWHLKGSKARIRGAAPKLFDECIYTPYTFGEVSDDMNGEEQHHDFQHRRYSDSMVEMPNDQIRYDYSNGSSTTSPYSNRVLQYHSRPDKPDFDMEVHTPEVFLFNYGTVVIWGMSLGEEHMFLKEISQFEAEKLDKADNQTEDFNFYYTSEYQARIYNDFISLVDKYNYMNKLAISHALSQSVKTSLFEDLLDNTIEQTKDIPSQIATTGKVNLTQREINMQIGELFILRINIHLQGSVLDAPELMWAEPQLDPVYQAVRTYLEIEQRVSLLTERLSVVADLLAVLKDQLAHTHEEYLEWIVIVLIATEIVVAAVNIIVDLYSGD